MNKVVILQGGPNTESQEKLRYYAHQHEKTEENGDNDHECRVVVFIVVEERTG